MSAMSYRADDMIRQDIGAYLKKHEEKSLMRFITCGSVDDGKSTLIGRLLYDSQLVFEDQLAQLKADSIKTGTQGKDIDFALLVDGLSAEREQGITIDVAYRFFSTEKRKFIVADTPGHEQYTRNMVTGASTADLAIILVDARKGVLPQTKRHSYIAHLLGIKNIVLAVNKMDLVEYDNAVFNDIVLQYNNFAQEVGIAAPVSIPISGVKGDNIINQSEHMPWFKGSSLMRYLENVELENDKALKEPFSMAVQWVNRPSLDFRGFTGKISSGKIWDGDEVKLLPSGKITTVDSIIVSAKEQNSASAGDAVTLTFADEVDCSRGDVITLAQQPLELADQFEATLIWMHEHQLIPGRSYEIKIGTLTLSAYFSQPKYQVNVNDLQHHAAKTLGLNDIGVLTVTTDRNIPYTSYAQNRELGGFIVIDKMTNATVAAGLLHFALRRSQNIHWHAVDVTREHHAKVKKQQPLVLWMTGLSGSGKSTIANEIEKKLSSMGKHTFLLDGDNIRHGLNKDLGFTEADRIENIRRVGEVAKLMTDAGLIVITAFISPFRAEREMVRKLLNDGEFVEIFVDTPLEIAEKRDVKGLYKKARAGNLKNFTGIDSPYEAPIQPEIVVDTSKLTAQEAAENIIEFIADRITI